MVPKSCFEEYAEKHGLRIVGMGWDLEPGDKYIVGTEGTGVLDKTFFCRSITKGWVISEDDEDYPFSLHDVYKVIYKHEVPTPINLEHTYVCVDDEGDIVTKDANGFLIACPAYDLEGVLTRKEIAERLVMLWNRDVSNRMLGSE